MTMFCRKVECRLGKLRVRENRRSCLPGGWQKAAACAATASSKGARNRRKRVEDSVPASTRLLAASSAAASTSRRHRQVGDLKGLDEYAGWLRSVAPEQIRDRLDAVSGPMEDYPRHPAIAEAAEWLFNDPASPWPPFLAKHPNVWYYRGALIDT